MATRTDLVMPDFAAGSDLGPAMLAINDRQRAFVMNLLDQGTRCNATEAYARAYEKTDHDVSTRVSAYKLFHHPKIIAAAKEMAERMLHSSAMLGAAVMTDLAQNGRSEAVRRQAAKDLLALSGFTEITVSRTEVVHKLDDKQLMQRIAALAKRNGIDPAVYLGNNAAVLDAEFEPVEADPDLLGEFE